MKQPLRIVAILYAAGLIVGNFLPLPLICLCAAAIAISAAALLLPRFRTLLLWPLLFFIGWTNLTFHTAILSPTDLRLLLTDQPALAAVRGKLISTPTKRLYTSRAGPTFTTTAQIRVTAIQLNSANWKTASGLIEAVTADLPDTFYRGREIQVYGVIGPPPKPIAEGLFDLRPFLRHQEMYFRLKAARTNDWQIVDTGNVPRPLSDRFTKWAESALALGLPPDDDCVRLEQALTFGDKTYFTDQTAEPFLRAATYHVFAIDGLRMAIFFFIFFGALRIARVPRNICGAILIPLIWFYVLLTGWPASAIRAAVMLTIVIGSWILKRPTNILNSLYAAALIILLWQPHQVFQAGFQLSFVVVFCILLTMPYLDKITTRLLQPDPFLPEKMRPAWQKILHRPLRFLLGLFFSSAAAWLGSIPLVAFYFHIFTPIGIVANVLAVPLCGFVLGCNLISIILASWLPLGAIISNHLAWHLMHTLRGVSIWFSHWPYAWAWMATPTILTILLYYAAFLTIVMGRIWRIEWRKTKLSILALLATAWSAQWIYFQTATCLAVLPLSGGSAIYCDAPGRANDFLINCGNEDSFDFVLKPFLAAHGVNSLPHLALTYGSEKQVGAFDDLAEMTSIKKVVTSDIRFRSPAYRQIIQSLEKTPGCQQIVRAGDQFSNLTALHPSATNHFSLADDNALVFSGTFQGVKILLLSDLGRAGQETLLEHNADLRADIVIAGLPEQNEPLNDTLLAAIQPKLIILSDSEFPVNRRATKTLRQRLERHGVPVLCTSNLGAVKITLRQNHWTAETIDGPACESPPSPARDDITSSPSPRKL